MSKNKLYILHLLRLDHGHAEFGPEGSAGSYDPLRRPYIQTDTWVIERSAWDEMGKPTEISVRVSNVSG